MVYGVVQRVPGRSVLAVYSAIFVALDKGDSGRVSTSK